MLPLIAMFCVPFFFKDIFRGVPHEKNIIAWCSVISKRLRNTDIDDPYEYEGINPLDCLAEKNYDGKHQNNEREEIQDVLMQDEYHMMSKPRVEL